MVTASFDDDVAIRMSVALADGRAGGSAYACADYCAVAAADLMTNRSSGCAADRPAEHRVTAFIEVGACAKRRADD
jgi:hypothetical protein